jgi:hypothetical protein
MRAFHICAVFCAAVAGCVTPATAVVRGQRIARPSFGYTDGRYFAFNHRRAHPAPLDPERERTIDDGSIEGRACGLDLLFYPSWIDHLVRMQGWARIAEDTTTSSRSAIAINVAIDVAADGTRRINGTTDMKTTFPVDLALGERFLRGQIGGQRFDLALANDALVGTMQLGGVPLPFAITHQAALRTMPPADQALLLVTMMTCTGARVTVGDEKVIGFALARQ